jgi:hypothetical protein
MNPFDQAWTILKGDYYHPSIQGFRESASQMPGNRMFPAPTEEEEEDVIQEVPLPPWASQYATPKTRNYGTMTERMPRPRVSSSPDSFSNVEYSPGYEEAVKNAKNEINIFNEYDKTSAGHDPMFQTSIPFPSIETFRLAGQRMSEDEYEREKMRYEHRNRRYHD